jgi:hypothetical protein
MHNLLQWQQLHNLQHYNTCSTNAVPRSSSGICDKPCCGMAHVVSQQQQRHACFEQHYQQQQHWQQTAQPLQPQTLVMSCGKRNQWLLNI